MQIEVTEVIKAQFQEEQRERPFVHSPPASAINARVDEAGGDDSYSTHPLSLSARLLVDKARSRLYRSQILQVNTRWKALAEIYTMHSFAPVSNLKIFVKNC